VYVMLSMAQTLSVMRTKGFRWTGSTHVRAGVVTGDSSRPLWLLMIFLLPMTLSITSIGTWQCSCRLLKRQSRGCSHTQVIGDC